MHWEKKGARSPRVCGCRSADRCEARGGVYGMLRHVGAVSACRPVKGHVWTAPGWQELSLRMQHWSVRPCVRPLDAAHMTAGHNALRGSGPGQKLAFDNALARVGCPDRRIDRLCITCCSPSNLHITPDAVRCDLVHA